MKQMKPVSKDQGNHIIRSTFYACLIAFILDSLACAVGSLVDGIVIGQSLGVDSMAAFGLVSPLMIVFSLFGALISAGARNRFTRLVGGGELERARGVFTLSVLLSVGLAALLMLGILLFSRQIAMALGATGNAAQLLEKTQAYLIGIAIGLPAINGMRILNAYMTLDNHRSLQVIASVVLSVTDILLDLAVVYVWHGDTFEMGLATSISYYLACLVLLTHFSRKQRLVAFRFRRLRWKEAGVIVWKGMPMAISRVSNTARSIFMNHLLAGAGSAGCIAAYSVHRQADAFLNPVTIGMADTVAMMTGILMGEENRPMLKRLLKTSVRATFFITLTVAAVFYLLAGVFAALFLKGDAEALRYGTRAAQLYAVGMPLYGINIIYENYVQSVGKTRTATLLGFLREAGFLMLSAQLLLPLVGADAAWVAFPVTQLLVFAASSGIICLIRKQEQLTGGDLWDRIAVLPNDFDVPEHDRMDQSITTMAQVAALSRQVWQFCTEHGCDARRRYLLSLSVEEMAGNVIEHGFTKDRKQHSVDVRILKKGEDYIIRIRDNCVIFDPLQRLQLYSPKDPAHHMGLRMIIGTAKDVQYTSVLKLNNLVLRV